MHNSQRSLLDLAREDLATARKRDPAARSSVEVALLYPGVHARWAHRGTAGCVEEHARDGVRRLRCRWSGPS